MPISGTCDLLPITFTTTDIRYALRVEFGSTLKVALRYMYMTQVPETGMSEACLRKPVLLVIKGGDKSFLRGVLLPSSTFWEGIHVVRW